MEGSETGYIRDGVGIFSPLHPKRTQVIYLSSRPRIALCMTILANLVSDHTAASVGQVELFDAESVPLQK